ncbi:AbrB/MazE/SpoVT family DNA-binding domain-containing protein [Fortiea contorta]|uniref:AbrB/MazE/SpoVT family DNA-binding domain-containing protein n=1 Tax=Fortiea contorta TaxID=1892405 RepID=UPI000362CC9C|nr:AbrB/MazE/SpoVT family DNA-binding domain-containing protein [Fortiea contorta]
MSELPAYAEVHLGAQGRLVIPAPLRRSLGWETGDVVIVRLEAGRLVLEKPELIKHRLKARFSHLPTGVSLAEDLLAERRQEAKRENFVKN